jgi:predicted nucleic acid-binding protein
MNVLIDANILLDVLLDRAPWANDSSAIWQACDDGRITGYIPASTLTDIFYIARRIIDTATARVAVGLCLATFAICPVDRPTLERAASLLGNDFEDNVVIACAIIAKLEVIVTRNSGDFAASPVPVLTPAALLTQIFAS